MSIDQVDTQDVFIPTDKGGDELKGGSTSLSSAAVALLVLFDGKSNLGEVTARAKGLSSADVRQAAQMLASGGYIELSHGLLDTNIDFSYFFGSPPASEPSATAVAQAGAEADAGTQSL